MTTLAAAVAVGDQQLIIDAPMAGPFPGWVKIDDEVLKVGGAQYREGTTLPLSESATAAHDSGATVTYASRPYSTTFNEAIGGAGGEQTVRLLGPFTLTFAAADAAFRSLTTIPAGALVVRAFARVTADWDQPVTITIGIGSTTDPEDNHSLVTYSNKQFFNEFWGADYEEAPASTPKVGFAVNAADLVAVLDVGTPATTGSVAIYALIAEPSA